MPVKQILTIKNYQDDTDLNLEVAGFMIQETERNAIKTIKLIIHRQPDKHSSRLGMFAFLHTRDGYQNLGFSEVNLTVDKYSDAGKFLTRKIYTFSGVRVENSLRRGDEELTFTANSLSEFEISQIQVFFD